MVKNHIAHTVVDENFGNRHQINKHRYIGIFQNAGITEREVTENTDAGNIGHRFAFFSVVVRKAELMKEF